MINLYQIITSIIIGIIEGITEFLPISSTGHMIIASHYLQTNYDTTKILEIFIQLGSTLAALYFFRQKIVIIIKNKIKHVILSNLPIIFFGLIFYKQIKLLFNLENIIYGLILGGLFLIFSEMFKPKKYIIYNINNINLLQAIIIGIFQILSLYPGFSRSGSTIATALLLGLKKSVAIEFSFIISIPLSIGIFLFEILNNMNNITRTDILISFIGCLSSFVVSMLCIQFLLKILNKTSLIFFGIYRFIISGLIYFLNS
ncbi:undecaprenyl-diphosphate phosphatase [Buchnera aphidicola]|uniref:undecaprenyl-diphosphate phosphatase n=1 Tax=Buchnera aphidicola TaxID=9 RepID=UPI003CE4D9C6